MVLILIGIEIAQEILRVGHMVLRGRESISHLLLILLIVQQKVRFTSIVFVDLEVDFLRSCNTERKIHPIGPRIGITGSCNGGGQDGLPGTNGAGGIGHRPIVGEAPQLVVLVVLDAGVHADAEGSHRSQRDAGDDQQHTEQSRG